MAGPARRWIDAAAEAAVGLADVVQERDGGQAGNQDWV